MTEHPIIFSAPMVGAILDGRRTQTRRVVKQATGPSLSVGMCDDDHGVAELSWLYGDGPGHDVHESIKRVRCPYGAPGSKLWVRETWMPDAPRDGTWPDTSFYGCKGSPLSMIPEVYRKPEHCLFRSTWSGHELIGWKPSMHMPRWASRITLEVTGVRVERLRDISAADCIAEGIARGGPENPDGIERREYRALWEQINGPDSWGANPWVWVVEFRRIAP